MMFGASTVAAITPSGRRVVAITFGAIRVAPFDNGGVVGCARLGVVAPGVWDGRGASRGFSGGRAGVADVAGAELFSRRGLEGPRHAGFSVEVIDASRGLGTTSRRHGDRGASTP